LTVQTVAFFGNLISGGTPRGALRLFRALAVELASRDDLELICLGDPAFDPSDPVGCTYECWDGRDFLSVLLAGELPKALEANLGSADNDAVSEPSIPAWLRRAEEMMSVYRRKVALSIRYHFSGITRLIRTILWKLADTSALVSRSLTPQVQPVALVSAASLKRSSFCNADIVGRVISLDRVDILLNFWWFHSPHGNPLAGRYRPRGLRVMSWFLDAIPLRVAHWQPGLIPVQEFRAGVQAHLESADEIVAISQSTAEDVATFFPHVRKPIHVVPCGIFEDDFDLPEGVEYVFRRLSLDLHVPLFTIIGFQEPSKNVPNALRALIKVAKATGTQIQVFIIGFGENVNLEDVLGPVARTLDGIVRIIFGGLVSEPVKRVVLSRSTALVYPSKWEGFGIPPLEAMAAGTQIVVSDIPPLREICIDLAEYCDPYAIDSISDAILRTMTKSPTELIRYVERAREHAKHYTWQVAAGRLHTVMTAPSLILESSRAG
jgi:glycosyltransferase involved in cell wall biosynthesis